MYTKSGRNETAGSLHAVSDLGGISSLDTALGEV